LSTAKQKNNKKPQEHPQPVQPKLTISGPLSTGFLGWKGKTPYPTCPGSVEGGGKASTLPSAPTRPAKNKNFRGGWRPPPPTKKPIAKKHQPPPPRLETTKLKQGGKWWSKGGTNPPWKENQGGGKKNGKLSRGGKNRKVVWGGVHLERMHGWGKKKKGWKNETQHRPLGGTTKKPPKPPRRPKKRSQGKSWSPGPLRPTITGRGGGGMSRGGGAQKLFGENPPWTARAEGKAKNIPNRSLTWLRKKHWGVTIDCHHKPQVPRGPKTRQGSQGFQQTEQKDFTPFTTRLPLGVPGTKEGGRGPIRLQQSKRKVGTGKGAGSADGKKSFFGEKIRPGDSSNT